MNTVNLRNQLDSYNDSVIMDSDGNCDKSCSYNFYDWFCKDSSLKKKAFRLFDHVEDFVRYFGVDMDSTYVFFKNNQPVNGKRYDQFKICDMVSGDVLWTVIPKSGHPGIGAQVWGVENNFEEPLYEGSDMRDIYRQKLGDNGN
jgi:hypothetical protein